MGSIANSKFIAATGTCDEHGPFSTWTAVGRPPRCPVCIQQWILETQAKARAQSPQGCRLWAASGVSDRYQNAHIDSVAVHGKSIRTWADRAATGYAPLFLLGTIGTGKTHAAAAAARLLCERGVPVLFGTEADYLNSIHASWDSNEATEESVRRLWTQAKVLVLDDIGAGCANEKDALRVHDLIDKRYNDQRSTVFVSNLKPDDLRRAVGDRAYDRMRDGATQLVFNGSSRRKPL